MSRPPLGPIYREAGWAAARLQMEVKRNLSERWSIRLIAVCFPDWIHTTAIAVLGQAPGARVPWDPSCRGGQAGKSPASASCRSA